MDIGDEVVMVAPYRGLAAGRIGTVDGTELPVGWQNNLYLVVFPPDPGEPPLKVWVPEDHLERA